MSCWHTRYDSAVLKISPQIGWTVGASGRIHAFHCCASRRFCGLLPNRANIIAQARELVPHCLGIIEFSESVRPRIGIGL
jgi:hypothetical protein